MFRNRFRFEGYVLIPTHFGKAVTRAGMSLYIAETEDGFNIRERITDNSNGFVFFPFFSQDFWVSSL